MALYIFIALATISAGAILVVRSVLYAALCLILCLLSVAGIFILLNTEFLAIVQILVYAGGILLLIIFGVMITRRHDDLAKTRLVPAALLGLTLLGLLWYGLNDTSPVISEVPDWGARQVGTSLMTDYAAPFEAAGVLLLISLIGAMVTSAFRSQR